MLQALELVLFQLLTVDNQLIEEVARSRFKYHKTFSLMLQFLGSPCTGMVISTVIIIDLFG